MQGSKISSKCWDVSQHCSVGSQKDDIFKDPAVRKGRHRSDVKNRLLRSFLCMQLWQEAIPNNSHLGLAVQHFQLSLTPAHLVILVLFFIFYKVLLLPPLLTSFISCQTGPRPGLPTRFFLTHLSWPAVQSATLILNLHLVSLQTYRALIMNTQTHTLQADLLHAQSMLCQASQKQREQRHPNTDFQKFFQVHLRVTPKLKKCC